MDPSSVETSCRYRHFLLTIALFQVNVAHKEQQIHMDVVLSGTNSDDTTHHPAEYIDVSDIHSFELERDDIKFVKLLGSGNFGEVFKATMGNDTVAVKSLKGETFYTVKDGASFCCCAYVLRISRYSGFLWVVPTNTGIFLRRLILCGKAKLSKYSWCPKGKLGGTMHFSEIMKLQFRKKCHTLLFILALFRRCRCLIISEKCVVTPNFLFEFQ